MPEGQEGNNPAEQLQGLLAKHNNDAMKLASQLFDENYQLRKDKRDLKSKIPADGAVTLSAEDAKEFQAFQALNKKASEIDTELKKIPTLETENKKLSKRDSLRSVAATGWDLEMLEENVSDKFPDAVFTVKKVKGADNKEVDTPFITLDGKESSLEDFGKEKFPKLLPVLKADAAQPIIPGNNHDPKPHVTTDKDVLKNEFQAQGQSGRYAAM